MVHEFLRLLPYFIVFVIAILFLLLRFDGGSSKVDGSELSSLIARNIQRKKQRDRLSKIQKSFYHVMSHIPLIGSYMRRVEQMYLAICPYDDALLLHYCTTTLVVIVIFIVIGICAVVALAFYLGYGLSWYCIGCIIAVVYLIAHEVLQLRIRAAESRMDENIKKYLSRLNHQFAMSGIIPKAIIDASDGMDYEIRVHALTLYNILCSADRARQVYEYVQSSQSNKFVAMLLTQAYETSERGDTENADGISLFSKNIEVLRVEVARNAHYKKNRAYRFHGFTFVATVPIFLMGILEKWGVDFSPSLSLFYDGSGKIVVGLAFLITYLVYDIIAKAREVSLERKHIVNQYISRLSKSSYVKRAMENMNDNPQKIIRKLKKMLTTCGESSVGVFLFRMLMFGIIMVGVSIIFFEIIHFQNRQQITTQVTNIDSVVMTASPKQKETISNIILKLVNDHLDDYNLDTDIITAEFNSLMFQPNKFIVNAAVTEVISRVVKYQNNYLKVPEYFLCLLLGIISASIPLVELIYQYRIVLSGKDDEVRQFQTVILMERNFPNVTVLSLLQDMESFSHIFRPSIRECINVFSAGPMQALKHLRAQESGFSDFTDIVDGLLAADSVGIAAAFSEIEHNREIMRETKELEEDILLNRKSDMTEIIAAIPIAFIFGGYFLIPFLYDVFNSVLDMFSSLEGLSKLIL